MDHMKTIRRLTEEDIIERAAARQRQRTLIERRTQSPFRVIDPEPKTFFDETIGERARRAFSTKFEEDLVAQQQSAQDTQRGYLLTGLFLLGLAACLVWKFWGVEISKLFQ